MTLSSRRSEVSPFVVMDVMRAAGQRAARGQEVLHLEVGQPGAGVPAGVLRAAQAALHGQALGYAPALGVTALREAIAFHYLATYGAAVDPGRVIVTPGSSGAFLLAFLAAFDQGARVAVPRPGYPCYRNILTALDLVAVDVPVAADSRYLVTPDILAALPEPVDGLIVSSPGNPTGTMYDAVGLRALADYCSAHGIQLISDEIYHGISFCGPASTALSHAPDAIVINSFSKYYAMTGWRVGWMIVPGPGVRRIERLAQNLFIATSTLSQLAALGAFDCRDELERHVQGYRSNRDVLFASLQGAGLSDMILPDGAFYIYAKVADRTADSVAYCARILEETGVAITPGVDFDPIAGLTSLRFSYAADAGTVERAASRLAQWFSQH